MKDLKGKTAVITGGATGIGLALALELSTKEEMNVVLASTNLERLQAAAKTVNEAGGEAFLVVCDVTDRASVQNLFDIVTNKYGATDLLCCNAGVTTGGPFLEHRPSDWAWVYDVVLQGTANCVQVFYPDMAKHKSGHIVLTGSQAGMVPDWVTEHGPYTSAKAAVHALGAALRPEAAEHGVGVTTIIVAGTLTDIIKSERSRPERYGGEGPKASKKREARRIPPGDVAEMVVQGVKENKAWVATHPELKTITKAYFDGILEAYDS
jgi:NAD(P)-dependent dehydrogenase (short-subunit alcohol dehydrogenase family)